MINELKMIKLLMHFYVVYCVPTYVCIMYVGIPAYSKLQKFQKTVNRSLQLVDYNISDAIVLLGIIFLCRFFLS